MVVTTGCGAFGAEAAIIIIGVDHAPHP